MEFLNINLTKELSLLLNNIHDTTTKRPASKGPDSKGPGTKGPATKGLGYERSGDERSGVLKVRQWKVRPQNISKLIQYFIYGKKSMKNVTDLP
jgi:hypothetical protein